jgi:hypothetical protein
VDQAGAIVSALFDEFVGNVEVFHDVLVLHVKHLDRLVNNVLILVFQSFKWLH